MLDRGEVVAEHPRDGSSLLVRDLSHYEGASTGRVLAPAPLIAAAALCGLVGLGAETGWGYRFYRSFDADSRTGNHSFPSGVATCAARSAAVPVWMETGVPSRTCHLGPELCARGGNHFFPSGVATCAARSAAVPVWLIFNSLVLELVDIR